jgi:hypothetical protein
MPALKAQSTRKEARRRPSPRPGTSGEQDLAAALGATRSLKLTRIPHGPFGAAALLEEIQSRLLSRGERPSDPSPTVRRLVPIKRNVWRRLKEHAALLSRNGKSVSPAQLAALVMEKGLSELH